jgi:hypothetical protein
MGVTIQQNKLRVIWDCMKTGLEFQGEEFLMKRLIGLLTLFILPAWPAQAETTPTATELFDRSALYLGSVALEPPSSIEAHAHVTVGDRTYDTEVWAAVGGGKLGDARFSIIRDGMKTTYHDENGTLFRTVNDADVKALPPGMYAFVHGHQFHRRILFPALELTSYEKNAVRSSFAGQEAFKVAGRTAGESSLTYYFEPKTGRILGFQLIVQEETGPRAMDFVLSDWRKDGDSTLFWRLEISDKDDLYIYDFNKILLLP